MDAKLVLFSLLFLRASDTKGSQCSDGAVSENVTYITMCTDSLVTSDTVILKTPEVGANEITRCSCIVTSNGSLNIRIQYNGIDTTRNISGCSSGNLIIKSTSPAGERRSNCTMSQDNGIYIPPVTVTWSGLLGFNYCLNVSGVVNSPNTTFAIECYKPETLSTNSSTCTAEMSQQLPQVSTLTTTSSSVVLPDVTNTTTSSSVVLPDVTNTSNTYLGIAITDQIASTVTPSDLITQAPDDNTVYMAAITVGTIVPLVIIITIGFALWFRHVHPAEGRRRQSYDNDMEMASSSLPHMRDTHGFASYDSTEEAQEYHNILCSQTNDGEEDMKKRITYPLYHPTNNVIVQSTFMEFIDKGQEAHDPYGDALPYMESIDKGQEVHDPHEDALPYMESIDKRQETHEPHEDAQRQNTRSA
ncbi:uncharacterized protein [Argopecten irradians]|uniref:uncharacterized protein n=1 Tax=Argopecten irradians TaxID=31199 RepID=UPI0037245C66